jgi:succinoglycan biosynthesis protein ExoA
MRGYGRSKSSSDKNRRRHDRLERLARYSGRRPGLMVGVGCPQAVRFLSTPTLLIAFKKGDEMTQGFPEGTPTVPILVVVPCLNEGHYIEGLITKLLREAVRLNIRIVVADGGSTDGTRAIAHRLAERDDRIILLDNRKRIQSAGVNSAIKGYGDKAKFLIRLDAHVDYPDRYCQRLLAVQAQTGADAVVVNMHATGRTCFQRAAAAAQNCFLGNGGSPHRNRSEGRWVEHGHHALISIPAFKAVCGYDEAFSHNEDADLDVRLIRDGYRIFLSGEAPIIYYPRESATTLFRQYFNFGCGRACNIIKNHCRPAIRQMLPLAITPAIRPTVAGTALSKIRISGAWLEPSLPRLWHCFGHSPGR